MNENRLFSNRDLTKLIWPLFLEQLLTLSVGVADAMMVSSVGEAAISGVSLVDMINILIIYMLAAMATGGSVVTSQYIGAKKEDAACKSANQLFVSAFSFSLIVSAVTLIFHRPLLKLLFGTIEADVMQACITYFVISALSFPLLSVYQCGAALFRAMGNSKITFKVSCLINAINIVGNAFCIFVLKMGVAGVALPTLVSRAVGGIVLFVLLKNEGLLIHIKKEKENWYPNKAEIKKILYIGIPSGIENSIFQLGRVIVVSIIALFGTTQIAANGVANNLDSIGTTIGAAMNLVMITVIGRCVGAGDEEQIRYYTKKLVLITYACTFVQNSLILLFMPKILTLYTLSAEANHLVRILVWMHNGVAILLWPAAFTFPCMLRACNDVKYPMVASIVSMFVCRVFLSYLVGVKMGYGAIGVWFGMDIDWILRITLFVIRYKRGAWRKTAHLAGA